MELDKCSEYIQALGAAESEGWGGAIMSAPKPNFDTLALARAEGEGMIAPAEPQLLTRDVESVVSAPVQESPQLQAVR